MALSRTQKEVAKNIAVIVLIQGTDEGGIPIYCYLGVRADVYDDFVHIQDNGKHIVPDDYGTVLAIGNGTPDTKTRSYMQKEYGFNHTTLNDNTPTASN